MFPHILSDRIFCLGLCLGIEIAHGVSQQFCSSLQLHRVLISFQVVNYHSKSVELVIEFIGSGFTTVPGSGCPKFTRV